MTPILEIGSIIVISGQLYPKSGNVMTSVTVMGLCDDDVKSVRVECDVHPHVRQITQLSDGSFVFQTKDFGPEAFKSQDFDPSKHGGHFATDTIPLTIVSEPTRFAA